jgi:hypothetical protein
MGALGVVERMSAYSRGAIRLQQRHKEIFMSLSGRRSAGHYRFVANPVTLHAASFPQARQFSAAINQHTWPTNFRRRYVERSSTSDGDGGQVVEFALGYDPDSDLIVLMAVMLTRTERGDTLELHFGIRTRISDGPASPPDYSKEGTDQYIPRLSRQIIRDLIRACVIRVVTGARSEYIVMETFYPNLPVKALQKYAAICGAIQICGYKLIDEFRDEISGINYWTFGKIDEPNKSA